MTDEEREYWKDLRNYPILDEYGFIWVRPDMMVAKEGSWKCCICDTKTPIIEVNYDIWICSQKCLHEFERPLREMEAAEAQAESEGWPYSF